MIKRWIALGALAAGLVAAWGCGMASTGINVIKNTQSNKLDIQVWLDGNEAKRDEFKQAATGYSQWKIKEKIGTAPRFKYALKDPSQTGRIRSVHLSFFQEYKGKFSDSAEFTIHAADVNNPQAQMQPGTDYDLANLGGQFKVLDFHGKHVPGVSLKPGLKYSLVFTVAADDSETAQIIFEAN